MHTCYRTTIKRKIVFILYLDLFPVKLTHLRNFNKKVTIACTHSISLEGNSQIALDINYGSLYC